MNIICQYVSIVIKYNLLSSETRIKCSFEEVVESLQLFSCWCAVVPVSEFPHQIPNASIIPEKMETRLKFSAPAGKKQVVLKI